MTSAQQHDAFVDPAAAQADWAREHGAVVVLFGDVVEFPRLAEYQVHGQVYFDIKQGLWYAIPADGPEIPVGGTAEAEAFLERHPCPYDWAAMAGAAPA